MPLDTPSSLPPQWDIRFEFVTPDRARELLDEKVNVGNRRLRPGLVKKYALGMEAGSWLTSPDAILLSTEKTLMNAQHRLRAVIASNQGHWFLFIQNVDPEIFRVLDRGTVRSVADALGIERKTAEVARLAAVVVQHSCNKNRIVTDQQIRVMSDLFGEAHDRLMSVAPTAVKFFSSAPVRLAACIASVVESEEEYAFSVYRNLVLGRLGDLPPIAQGFVSAVVRGAIDAQGGGDLQMKNLLRARDVFDCNKAENTKTQIKAFHKRIVALGVRLRPDGWIG